MDARELSHALRRVAPVLKDGERTHPPGSDRHWLALTVEDHAARAAVHLEKYLLGLKDEPHLEHARTRLGGWGETCLADKDPALKGKGTSTPSQTAWALIGLLAGENGLSDSAIRGAAWLMEQQNGDGRWEDSEFTGTGFPNHLYLRYHMYAHYFPLMALGRFRQRILPQNSQRPR